MLAIAANAATFARPGDVNLTVVFSGGLQPLLVGLLVLSIGLSLGGPTGYAINPARDLGPRLAHALSSRSPASATPIGATRGFPIVGPIIGGVLGALLFRLSGSSCNASGARRSV